MRPLLSMLTPCGRPTALPSAEPLTAADPANCVSPEKFRLSERVAAPETVAVKADPGSAPVTMLPLVSKPTVPELLVRPVALPSKVAVQFQFSAAGETPGPAFWK